MTNKEKFRELCEKEPSISIFSKDWWMDAGSDNNYWDVVLVEKGGEIIAAMPFLISKKFNLKKIYMPVLGEHIQIWIKYPPGQKYTNKLAFEKDIYFELIEKLPKFNLLNLSFDCSMTNWLPFYWKGFQENTKYTYVIENLKDHDLIFNDFKDNIKREIRKAQKILKVCDDMDINKFYEINRKTFERQNIGIQYSFEMLNSVDRECSKRNCRKIFYAVDENNNIHTAIYFVWDENSSYYILGGSDPDLRTSGSASLVMWEAIKFSSTVTKNFDFGGSMIEPIERFFRGFGAIQKPYFNIYKTNSKLIKIKEFLTNF
jgi:hypothetical protein